MVKTALMAAKIRPPGGPAPPPAASSTAAVHRFGGRMLGDPRQDVGEPDLWIDVIHFGGDD